MIKIFSSRSDLLKELIECNIDMSIVNEIDDSEYNRLTSYYYQMLTIYNKIVIGKNDYDMFANIHICFLQYMKKYR